MYRFSKQSNARMEGVHPDLIRLIKLALKYSEIDFCVIEGVRTYARQEYLCKKGASTTLNSRHLTGHAVDLCPWLTDQLSWHWPLFYKISSSVKKASGKLNIPVEWGGDWTVFKDGPHFQLPWGTYKL